ncbi:flagellar protein FliT [Undibacterium sp. SXout11W]|uniref:flagellar protein FliT n=1 Tax=Undibacterium sp. SXout11W TaxID=3413050 RepID=UPI003BF00EF7
MESTELISLYENVAIITDQMLRAARERDWELLCQLESNCSSTVAIIQKNEIPVSLTPELREQKIRMIKKILADDKEIRDITEPWMAELADLIKSNTTSRKLNQAYGASKTF